VSGHHGFGEDEHPDGAFKESDMTLTTPSQRPDAKKNRERWLSR
jgi:hypothetical protein